MSLGTGALKVGREPKRFKHSKELSMTTMRAGTTQHTQLSKVLQSNNTTYFMNIMY